MHIVINKGHVSPSLTVQVFRDILDYYRDHLDSENPFNATPLVLYLIEDEIYERFGYEIEEVERAFEKYFDHLRDYEILVNSIREGRLIEDLQEFSNS